MADGPTDDFKVDTVRFPTLRDPELQVFRNGESITAIHTPTGVSVEADTRGTADDNWQLAQEALQQGVEHRLSSETKSDV
jgi:hypothetical protein